jgi:hypothetical protein
MSDKNERSIPDSGKGAGQLLAERAKRLEDALNLRKPDRIPIMLPASYLLAELAGITKQELHENMEKAQKALEKVALEYQPDSIFGPMPTDPRPHLLLQDRMTVWPGHGVGPNVQFQFVEKEFMKADDYDEFLDDPADWAFRVYLPRAFGALEGFSLLPPLGTYLFGCYNLMNLNLLMAPSLVTSFRAIAEAAQIVADDMILNMKNSERMAASGFPPSVLAGVTLEAPYDLMSDTLRGMRGIMLDILQRPDKLLAAEEKVSGFQLKFAVSFSQATGLKRAFLPLHRGSDGFMSLAQFERFYWPQLKHMLVFLVDHDIMPVVFYEGTWDQRLSYLAELPKGKTVGWFQSSNIFKVKETLGNTMCIIGGMPNSMLKGSTPEAVRIHTQEVCRTVGKGGGFIFCTGVGEMSGSRPELVKAFVEAAKEFGTY